MTNLHVQLIASACLVLGVILFMWRLPKASDALYAWGPALAIISAWVGLLALIMHITLFFLPYPDYWLTLLFLGVDPSGICAGTLVLWIFRGIDDNTATLEKLPQNDPNQLGPIEMQKIQAKVGITLGLLAVAVGYIYVLTVKPPEIWVW